MGILDTAKAFARVGAAKVGRGATDAGARGARLAADGAAKGAAALNDAAGKVRDGAAEPAERRGGRPEDGGASRRA
jgi:hypothetical protein